MSAPWKAVQQRGLGVIVQAANGEHIATVYSHQHANTIAAAPELLEALQHMCSVWVTVCNSKGWDPEHASQFTDARTAIAKATGSTHV